MGCSSPAMAAIRTNGGMAWPVALDPDSATSHLPVNVFCVEGGMIWHMEGIGMWPKERSRKEGGHGSNGGQGVS